MPHCCVGADATLLGCTVTTVKRTRVTQEFFTAYEHTEMWACACRLYLVRQYIRYAADRIRPVMHHDSLSLE